MLLLLSFISSSSTLLSQRQFKLIHASMLPPHHGPSSASKQLLSSAVATVVSRQQISAIFPIQQLMQHNYIIKTCMTTYTYLTTVVHNKRSAISTFETIVSVVTTESLTNLYNTDVIPDLKPTKVRFGNPVGKTLHEPFCPWTPVNPTSMTLFGKI